MSTLCSLCLRGKSHVLSTLQPLWRPQKSQLLCNQPNPASFSKIPGCGVGIPIPSLDSRRESTKTPGAGDATTRHPGWGVPNESAGRLRQATSKMPACSPQVPLESTLAKVYQNKQLYLPLESTLMKNPGRGVPSVPRCQNRNVNCKAPATVRGRYIGAKPNQEGPRQSAAATFGDDGMGERTSACVAAPDFRGRFWVCAAGGKDAPRRAVASTYVETGTSTAKAPATVRGLYIWR
jgi:hypothetical protein